ncbi:quercetin dioxygenase-like cupin family protein [Nocardiopsis arvandica]|uniref:Quercetin dioxygenase-like cupin family protein n=1 Tax=Nocardiopsis sinuspersici TaxID=501010 RepID=A0A7Y9XJ82_9ACTN|nr:nuclear transport factor 2 family protein [Nocardiopsis sinuspersici]NYH55445.1 quercetin dioxygenase-like cupin family protein [Nocardiopsis sinuspersici]
MSAPTQSRPGFDVDRYTRAVEASDADALVSQYSDDAEMEMIDRRTPPSAPTVLHGRDEIGEAVRDLCSREMTHEVLQSVADDKHVAYTERCTYPDGNEVLSMTMLDLRDGRIVHQSTVQAWDEEARAMESARFAPVPEREQADHENLEAATVGGQTVVRLELEPGWRWSEHAKPFQGTDSCMMTHCGYIVSGTLCCRMDDGTEKEFHTGDVAFVPAGHDAWVVGDETATVIDWRAANPG